MGRMAYSNEPSGYRRFERQRWARLPCPNLGGRL